jgi:hypothetical protein
MTHSQDALLRYTMIEIANKKITDCENLLTFLVQEDFNHCLSTYFATGKINIYKVKNSILEMMKWQTATIFLKYLNGLTPLKRQAILSRVEICEIKSLFKLSNSIGYKLFKLFTEEDSITFEHVRAA